MERDVINLASETVGTVELDEAIFGVAVRPDILARTVNWQLAKRRAGTHKTKLRGEVARSGKKPFKQKGTGRARQGSTKGPHMRGGGIVFGENTRESFGLFWSAHAVDWTAGYETPPRQKSVKASDRSQFSGQRGRFSAFLVKPLQIGPHRIRRNRTRIDGRGFPPAQEQKPVQLPKI